jgi:hypothetical protein
VEDTDYCFTLFKPVVLNWFKITEAKDESVNGTNARYHTR